MLAAWGGTVLHMYRRYIDDMFFIWYGTEEELLKFIEHCNNFHETIKFEFSCNFKTKSVDFLDMTIDHNGFIQTDLFQKPGKKCQYLQPDSAHPKHCTRSIPYSLSYRLRRICSLALEYSAGVNAKTKFVDTPLHLACHSLAYPAAALERLCTAV